MVNLNNLVTQIRLLLNTKAKQQLWKYILNRLTPRQQLQAKHYIKGLSENHDTEKKNAQQNDSGWSSDATFDTLDWKGRTNSLVSSKQVAEFRSQLQYYLTLKERQQLKKALQLYSQKRNIDLMIKETSQILNTPSKRTLWKYMFPLLSAAHRHYSKYLINLADISEHKSTALNIDSLTEKSHHSRIEKRFNDYSPLRNTPFRTQTIIGENPTTPHKSQTPYGVASQYKELDDSSLIGSPSNNRTYLDVNPVPGNVTNNRPRYLEPDMYTSYSTNISPRFDLYDDLDDNKEPIYMNTYFQKKKKTIKSPFARWRSASKRSVLDSDLFFSSWEKKSFPKYYSDTQQVPTSQVAGSFNRFIETSSQTAFPTMVFEAHADRHGMSTSQPNLSLDAENFMLRNPDVESRIAIHLPRPSLNIRPPTAIYHHSPLKLDLPSFLSPVSPNKTADRSIDDYKTIIRVNDDESSDNRRYFGTNMFNNGNTHSLLSENQSFSNGMTGQINSTINPDIFFAQNHGESFHNNHMHKNRSTFSYSKVSSTSDNVPAIGKRISVEAEVHSEHVYNQIHDSKHSSDENITDKNRKHSANSYGGLSPNTNTEDTFGHIMNVERYGEANFKRHGIRSDNSRSNVKRFNKHHMIRSRNHYPRSDLRSEDERGDGDVQSDLDASSTPNGSDVRFKKKTLNNLANNKPNSANTLKSFNSLALGQNGKQIIDGETLNGGQLLDDEESVLKELDDVVDAAAMPSYFTNIPPPPPPGPPPKLVKDGFSLQKNVSVKRINWEKIDKVDDMTVWSKQIGGNEELEEVVKYLELEQQFSTKKSTLSEAFKDKKIEAGILGARKAYNISILLAHMRTSVADVKQALLLMDEKILTSEILKPLLNFSPDDKEMERYDEYRGLVSDLSEADKFTYQVSRVPDYKIRLQAMLFKSNFDEKVQDVKMRLRNIKKASLELMRSQKLTKILEIMLAMGNYLNKGNSRVGEALGFKISFLSHIDQTKTSDGKANLLHVLAEAVESRHPDAAKLADDLPTIPEAAKISNTAIKEEMSELRNVLQQISSKVSELSNQKNKATSNDKFYQIMQNFVISASDEMQSLFSLQSSVNNDFQQVIQYFGGSAKDLINFEIFTIFAEFLKKFEKAKQFNKTHKRSNSQNIVIIEKRNI